MPMANEQARHQFPSCSTSMDIGQEHLYTRDQEFETPKGPEKPFRFLDLPPEIREQIYKCYYTASSDNFAETTNYVTLFTAALEFPMGLLLTCFQTYTESRHHFFSINAFSITIQRTQYNSQFDWFLTPEFQDHRRLISNIRLTVDRWGSSSWFLESFLPCLEDMILNGRLRELEVRLPNTLARSNGNCYPPNNEMTLELKRLCEDPYLERVVVKSYDRDQLRRLQQRLYDIGEIWLTDISWQLDRPKLQDGTGTWPWTSLAAQRWDKEREERRKAIHGNCSFPNLANSARI